jgi:hypothetical protein
MGDTVVYGDKFARQYKAVGMPPGIPVLNPARYKKDQLRAILAVLDQVSFERILEEAGEEADEEAGEEAGEGADEEAGEEAEERDGGRGVLGSLFDRLRSTI